MSATLHRQALQAPFRASRTSPACRQLTCQLNVHAGHKQVTVRQQTSPEVTVAAEASRRQILRLAGVLASAAVITGSSLPAKAFVATPDGYKAQVDK